MGRKQLYLFDKKMRPYEGNFVCLLDFYVHYTKHEELQPIGARLFTFMMESEGVEHAFQIPLDNPSTILLSFMAKQFGLQQPLWQNTNFVVFPQIFFNDKVKETGT